MTNGPNQHGLNEHRSVDQRAEAANMSAPPQVGVLPAVTGEGNDALGPVPAASPTADVTLMTKGSAVFLRRLQIVNKRGLHARASAKFVSCVDRFDADVTVSRDGQSVGGNSIMGLMMLAASTGSFIDVKATGKEAEAALSALDDLVSNGFGEAD